MQSVTSNAVAETISSAIDKLIHIATSETITDGETKQFTLAQNIPYLFMNTHLNHCELIIFINFYNFNYITTYRIFNSNSTEMTNFTKAYDNVIEITAPSNCRGSIWRLGQTIST